MKKSVFLVIYFIENFVLIFLFAKIRPFQALESNSFVLDHQFLYGFITIAPILTISMIFPALSGLVLGRFVKTDNVKAGLIITSAVLSGLIISTDLVFYSSFNINRLINIHMLALLLMIFIFSTYSYRLSVKLNKANMELI